VRAADRDDAVHTLRTTIGGQPGPDRQPSHAVAHHHWLEARGLLDAPHRLFNDGRVVADGAEHRLQVHRDKGDALFAQAWQPAVPEAAVADKAMHQHHASLA